MFSLTSFPHIKRLTIFCCNVMYFQYQYISWQFFQQLLKCWIKVVDQQNITRAMSLHIHLDILHFDLSKSLFSISFGAQVKVVLRVNPKLPGDQGQPPVLWTDPSKKRVTIMEPVSMKPPHSTMTLGRDGKNFLKTFNFDAAYNQESSQVCFYFISTT